MTQDPSQDLSGFLGHDRFATVMADPPWRFVNRTGKVAPEQPMACDILNDGQALEDLEGEGR